MKSFSFFSNKASSVWREEGIYFVFLKPVLSIRWEAAMEQSDMGKINIISVIIIINSV